jgi:hypothetical protein
MKILDLFAGTRSIAKAFEEQGHESYSIELDSQHENIDWYTDIMEVTAQDVLERFGRPDVIWASPPCTSFSIAGRHHHRTPNGNGGYTPVSEFAHLSDKLILHVFSLIDELKPRYWYIENPRGLLHKMDYMQEFEPQKHFITYCQYGDFRMKPTHIWTNHPNPQFKPRCKNGMPCHESAPRGSKTGTQGLKGALLRSIIPHELCMHIAEVSK